MFSVSRTSRGSSSLDQTRMLRRVQRLKTSTSNSLVQFESRGLKFAQMDFDSPRNYQSRPVPGPAPGARRGKFDRTDKWARTTRNKKTGRKTERSTRHGKKRCFGVLRRKRENVKPKQNERQYAATRVKTLFLLTDSGHKVIFFGDR